MKPENVKCPECDGPMMSRQNRQDGTRFWGCKAYPRCRGTRDSEGRSHRERDRSDGRDDLDDRAPSERQRANDRQRWRA